jgi:plastocyanin
MSVFRVDADIYAFTPTYLRGDPGQPLKLVVENSNNDVTHNFTLTAQGLIQDIPPDRAVEMDITFPQSGAQLFLCTYHATQGMKGQLLTGDASPQPNP